MAFNKQAPKWGATGIEPPESKRKIGWEVEDRPPAAWLNWFMNLTAESLQELQIKAAEKTYVDEQIEEAIAGIEVIHDASVTAKGITKLSSAVNSASETEAATPKAIKWVNDSITKHSADNALQFGLKLDAVSYTASDILTKIKTVDGSGSGLDADLLDGRDSTTFLTNGYTENGAHIVFHKNANGHQYHSGQLELQTTDGSYVTLGFHRAGLTAVSLVHDSSRNGLRLLTSDGNSFAPFEAILVTAAHTSYSSRFVRNTIMSTTDPSGGQAGDIWIKYSP